MNIQVALKSQYHAALAMLKQAIDRCPDDLWTGGDHPNPVWHITYHVLFFTHLYLQLDERAFHPWESHREEYQFLGSVPWPPHRPPRIREAYLKPQMLDYWRFCDGMIDAGVDQLDLNASECGFWWYKMPKLEHQLMNIRHIQHHAAQIAYRVRLRAGHGVDWVGSST